MKTAASKHVVNELSIEARAAISELIALREMLLTSTKASVRAVAEGAILPRIEALARGASLHTLTPRQLIKWADALQLDQMLGRAPLTDRQKRVTGAHA